VATKALPATRLSFQEEAMWLMPVGIIAFGLLIVAQVVGFFFDLSPSTMLSGNGYKALRMLPPVLAAGFIVLLILAAREQPKAPTSAFLRRIRQSVAHPWLAAARFGPLLLMPVLFVGFSSLKMLMPRFVPFWLDDTWAGLDRALFFGYQPWELTHALFGSGPATAFIDRLYWMWILLLSLAIVSFALFAPRPDRARFFMSFTLAWLILGVFGAWLGASAGPVYTGLVGAASAPEYAGLVARLDRISMLDGLYLDAPHWQQVLWSAHATKTYSFGMGVSAMPSLHNAIAVLYALAGFRIGRHLGWVLTAYAGLVFVGSIHLGWHYASDGIFAGIAMVLIWRWVDRWCRRSGYDAAVGASQSPDFPDSRVVQPS